MLPLHTNVHKNEEKKIHIFAFSEYQFLLKTNYMLPLCNKGLKRGSVNLLH